MRRSWVFRSVAAVAVLVSWSLSPSPARAVTDPDGLTRWPGRVVVVHDPSRDPLVAEAVRDWDRLGVIRVGMTDAACRPGQACIEIRWTDLPNHIGGNTPTRYDLRTRHIMSATVQLNRLYWWLPPSWALNVRAHEIGHALGLVHVPAGVCAVMSAVGCDQPTPTAYDAWMLQEAYRLP